MTKFINLYFWKLDGRGISPGYKVKAGPDFRGFRVDPFLLFLLLRAPFSVAPGSVSLFLKLGRGLWPHPLVTVLSLGFSSASSSMFKDTHDYIGLYQVIQDNLLHSKPVDNSLNSICNLKPTLSHNLTFSQFHRLDGLAAVLDINTSWPRSFHHKC